MTIQVLNGPNLGRLGTREPEVYGSTTYAQLADLLETAGRELGVEVRVRQTDDEAEMLRWVHEATDARDPVILNPAAWSHTSIALHDALAALQAVMRSDKKARGASLRFVVLDGIGRPTILTDPDQAWLDAAWRAVAEEA